MPEFEPFGTQNSTCSSQSPHSPAVSRFTVLSALLLSNTPVPGVERKALLLAGFKATLCTAAQVPVGAFHPVRSLPLKSSTGSAASADALSAEAVSATRRSGIDFLGLPLGHRKLTLAMDIGKILP